MKDILVAGDTFLYGDDSAGKPQKRKVLLYSQGILRGAHGMVQMISEGMGIFPIALWTCKGKIRRALGYFFMQ